VLCFFEWCLTLFFLFLFSMWSNNFFRLPVGLVFFCVSNYVNSYSSLLECIIFIILLFAIFFKTVLYLQRNLSSSLPSPRKLPIWEYMGRSMGEQEFSILFLFACFIFQIFFFCRFFHISNILFFLLLFG